jgi:hypothetical protein
MPRKNLRRKAIPSRVLKAIEEAIAGGEPWQDALRRTHRIEGDELAYYASLCYRCGEPGHVLAACPETGCNRCGGKGHMAKHCPERDQ